MQQMIGLVLGAALIALAVDPAAARQAAVQQTTSQAEPAVFTVNPKQRIRVVEIANGLFHPWSLAFLPDGTMLIAERNGRLRVFRGGKLLSEPAWTMPGTTNDRLHGIAVHPEFANNGLVYMAYPKTGERGNTLAVAPADASTAPR